MSFCSVPMRSRRGVGGLVYAWQALSSRDEILQLGEKTASRKCIRVGIVSVSGRLRLRALKTNVGCDDMLL